MGKINGNSLLMKEVNTNIVRNALRQEMTATKQRLSVLTGLSIVTVGSILQQLLEKGEVYEDGAVASKGGRPAQTFCYNKNFLNILTISAYEETGKDMASVCVRNILGEIVCREEKILDNPDINVFEEIINDFMEKFSNIKAIGFSMPGEENNGTIILHDYEKLNGIKFREHFQNRYNLPVVFENDVNSAVIGYRKNISSKNIDFEKDLSSIIYIYFPEKYPPGAGIYLDGKIYKGFNGTGGEIKYIPLGIDWEKIDYSSEKKIVDMASKLITAVSAMLNPQKVVLYGNFFTENILTEIEKKCRKMLKEIFTPEILLSENFKEDFEQGITEITLDLLIPKLSLQE